jgi:hypothetical protein
VVRVAKDSNVLCGFICVWVRSKMSSSQAINVGIVGLGWPAERHAEALNASPLGSVYAACDQNAERLKAFGDAFGPKQSFTSFDEMAGSQTGPKREVFDDCLWTKRIVGGYRCVQD